MRPFRNLDTSRPSHANNADVGAALSIWFEAERRARILVSRNLNFVWCNAAGRDLLTKPSPLVLRNGGLTTRRLARMKSFADFVRRATHAASVFVLPTNEDDAHLITIARCLEGLPLIGLSAYFTAFRIEQWADLHEAFGLTRTECEIVKALMGGLTTEGAAERLKASIKTVRTHIRHIYGKLHVSAREELFHKLAPYLLTE